MTITIGAITLRDFEVPSGVRFGGTQRSVAHRLGDGRRIIDLLGRDEADITFSGVIGGPDASARARELDALRTSGQQVTLQWDSFQFNVIVRQFLADFQSRNWIQYQLSCAVLDQPTADRTADQSAGRTTLGDDLAYLNGRQDALLRYGGRGADRPNLTSIAVETRQGASELINILDAMVATANNEIAGIEREIVDIHDSASVDNIPISAADHARAIAQAIIDRAYLARAKVSLAETYLT